MTGVCRPHQKTCWTHGFSSRLLRCPPTPIAGNAWEVYQTKFKLSLNPENNFPRVVFTPKRAWHADGIRAAKGLKAAIARHLQQCAHASSKRYRRIKTQTTDLIIIAQYPHATIKKAMSKKITARIFRPCIVITLCSKV